MATTTSINIRMDSALKRDFDQFCDEMGMNMSTAVNIFARKVVREQKIPFEIGVASGVANRETIEAMEDARLGRNLHGPYGSVKELMESLDAED